METDDITSNLHENWLSEILGNFKLNIEYLDSKSSMPFHNWICKNILSQSLTAISSIKSQIENSPRSGFNAFDKKVSEYLNFNVPTNFILALCGKKSNNQDLSLAYFDKFYNYAQRETIRFNHEDNLFVCRIFIEPSDGFSDHINNIISIHDLNLKNGVVSLIIEKSQRNHIEMLYDNYFCQCVDNGVGFLFIGSKINSGYKFNAIVHEGFDKNISFAELGDRLILGLIFDMFKSLYPLTKEYQDQSVQIHLNKKARVENLMKRIQL